MQNNRDIMYGKGDPADEFLDRTTQLLSSNALIDEDPLTRKHAIYLLGLTLSPECIPVFIAALRDPEKAVRNRATRVLADIGKPALSHLILLLEDPDWKVRYRAAEALGIMKDQEATDPLIPRLTDEKDHVRYMAVKALGELGDEQAMMFIRLRLLDENPYVRKISASVLEKMKSDNKPIA